MADTKTGAAQKPRMHLRNRQLLTIAAEVLCDPSTVRRWAAGHEVLETTDARIRRAIAKLGIKAA